MVESRSAGNEETWAPMSAKLSPADHAAVSAAVAAVEVLASTTEVAEGSKYSPVATGR